MSKITFTVSSDPAKPVRIAVDGVSGPGCTDLTAAVEAALGKTTGCTHTEEYDQVSPVQQEQGLRDAL